MARIAYQSIVFRKDSQGQVRCTSVERGSDQGKARKVPYVEA